MDFSDNLGKEIENFIRSKDAGKAFLFKDGAAYHFYNNEFCRLEGAKLSLSCQALKVWLQVPGEGDGGLFIRLKENKLFIATDTLSEAYDLEEPLKEKLEFALTYCVICDEAKKTRLYGVAYANVTMTPRIINSYYTDAAIAALLDLLIFKRQGASCLAEKTGPICSLIKEINIAEVKALAKLYLQGQDNSSFDLGYINKKDERLI